MMTNKHYLVGTQKQLQDIVTNIDNKYGYPNNDTSTYAPLIKHISQDLYAIPVDIRYIDDVSEQDLETLGVDRLSADWYLNPNS